MSTADSVIQIPERRRHQSPDIIDIDALDADDVVYVGSARPRQRRRVNEAARALPVDREIINLTDSEEDNEIQFIGHNPARPPPPLVGRNRIFSPPPPPQMGGIPPVPPIPHRFLPLRPSPPPGLVVPNEDPLPFEADLQPQPSVERPRPAAAPPSHHVPSMGLGGALLAGVRRIIAPRSTSHRAERHDGWGVSRTFVVRWDPFDLVGGEEADLLDGLDDIGLWGEEADHWTGGRVRGQLERVLIQRDRSGRAEPDYKPEYTHPEPSLPGFTHDFSPSSAPSPIEEDATFPSSLASGSKNRLCEASLVCAACRDPLVVGDSDVGADRAKRKLWGLRCGHLLDGKCIQELMEPVPPTSETNGSSSTTKGSESGQHPSSSQDTVVEDSASMRSRLRPRRGMSGRLTPAPHVPSTSRRGIFGGTHRSNRKGKGKMKVPIVEAEHEWSCPVSGCGHAHLSLLMDGRWTMDEKRGAIAVFA